MCIHTCRKGYCRREFGMTWLKSCSALHRINEEVMIRATKSLLSYEALLDSRFKKFILVLDIFRYIAFEVPGPQQSTQTDSGGVVGMHWKGAVPNPQEFDAPDIIDGKHACTYGWMEMFTHIYVCVCLKECITTCRHVMNACRCAWMLAWRGVIIKSVHYIHKSNLVESFDVRCPGHDI